LQAVKEKATKKVKHGHCVRVNLDRTLHRFMGGEDQHWGGRGSSAGLKKGKRAGIRHIARLSKEGIVVQRRVAVGENGEIKNIERLGDCEKEQRETGA